MQEEKDDSQGDRLKQFIIEWIGVTEKRATHWKTVDSEYKEKIRGHQARSRHVQCLYLIYTCHDHRQQRLEIRLIHSRVNRSFESHSIAQENVWWTNYVKLRKHSVRMPLRTWTHRCL